MQHDQTTPSASDEARIKIIESIARKLLLTARYNSQPMTLAPHALFARHGELFVSALNLSKNWRSEEERRLGHFKLAGLSDVAVIEEPFDILADAGPLAPGPADELLLAVA